MGRVIDPSEFESADTVALARWLLGKNLIRIRGTQRLSLPITEVEAYEGEEDLACHASKGRTKRTETLYAPGGIWYVYLIYGLHTMLNLVTGPRDRPSAVLIRSAGQVCGPGRLTRNLEIGLAFNGLRTEVKSGLYVEEDGVGVRSGRIRATPRIGVDYAGPHWAAIPWRFALESRAAGKDVVGLKGET
jgi:DNA-3-methyladenine glycosylase